MVYDAGFVTGTYNKPPRLDNSGRRIRYLNRTYHVLQYLVYPTPGIMSRIDKRLDYNVSLSQLRIVDLDALVWNPPR